MCNAFSFLFSLICRLILTTKVFAMWRLHKKVIAGQERLDEMRYSLSIHIIALFDILLFFFFLL